MKSVLDQSTRDELIRRIGSLTEHQVSAWGNMNVYQMLRHCVLWDEMVLRNKKYRRVFIGWLLGKFMLRKELKDNSPMRKNNPSIPELIIHETNGNISAEKAKWIALINEYAHYSVSDLGFVHPFFGAMTREQVGYFAYKHSDHHLRQFNS